jgi:hypothetical protein
LTTLSVMRVMSLSQITMETWPRFLLVEGENTSPCIYLFFLNMLKLKISFWFSIWYDDEEGFSELNLNCRES